MALPLIPFIFKIIVLKIFKGAFIGFSRYFLRIFRKPQVNTKGDSLKGMDHINQVVNKEWKQKDNIIFLILMLCSALYGLQEIIVWCWIRYAKWRHSIFFAFTPAGLELPDDFIQRVHDLSWFRIIFEVIKWVLTASLLYWPKTSNKIEIKAEDNKKWVSINYNGKIVLMRTDAARKHTYRGMNISINADGDVDIKSTSGLTTHYKAKV